jgi:hypothetical protein
MAREPNAAESSSLGILSLPNFPRKQIYIHTAFSKQVNPVMPVENRAVRPDLEAVFAAG